MAVALGRRIVVLVVATMMVAGPALADRGGNGKGVGQGEGGGKVNNPGKHKGHDGPGGF